MIESIKATNFQSLQNVNLELGKFTVIVGASSSGKSALTRAMKAVASNKLDSDYITRGTKKSSVSMTTEDTVVTIERESGGSSVYKIAKLGGQESRFARLNRQVPAEVTAALGIIPSTQEVASINFAGQFDSPYLLQEGASSVARVLGELTNVSTIFAAVKEANRRAKNASALVNLRKKDEAKLLSDLKKFSTIGKDSKAITRAEAIMSECLELEAKITRLRGLLDTATQALSSLETIKKIPELPDIALLVEAHNKLSRFKDLVRTVSVQQKIISASSTEVATTDKDLSVAQDELHQLLTEAGTCPTCNQSIH